MSEKVITPDLGFVKDVIASGGESLKKCYQCATCTVVCNVTPDDKPFPRKEMVQAQWGLKEELFRNPDIWLCHQCSDCTAYCPRGAKPGEVLGAIRKMSLQHYSTPVLLAKAVASPKALIPLLIVPAVIVFLIAAVFGHLANIPKGENGGIVYGNFMPPMALEVLFMVTSLLVVVLFARGVMKYWKDMARDLSKSQVMMAGGLFGALSGAVREILGHNKFRKCNVASQRSISHLLVFYSFLGLAATAVWGAFYLYAMKIESPYPLLDPMKLLGNASALGLFAGITLVVLFRLINAREAGIGSYYDWLLLGTIAAIAVTGVMSELLRLANVPLLAYPTYFAHLTIVLFFFIYAPFSKMAHMVYRTTAMVYANMEGRK